MVEVEVLRENDENDGQVVNDADGVGKPSGKDLSDKARFAAYFALQFLQNRDGKVDKKDKVLVAGLLKTSIRTVEKIWKDAREQIAAGEEVDVSSKKKGRVGRMRKDLDLSRVTTIPFNRRKTLRALARELDVSKTTLYNRFQWGELERCTNTLKPFLKPANKIERLKFCMSMLDENSITDGDHYFNEMDNFVHIDEKWFNMTQKNNTYYLVPGEATPFRTVQNKNSIGKVMFLTAVAKPRFATIDGERVCTFDGKIGTWAFVTETAAVRRSENRERGTLELKSLKVNRDVMRDFMCHKVIPAILDLWPDEDAGRTIYIQQDNATPHIRPNDPVFLQVIAQTDLNIQLIQQPPNSPDMNVLDLCFFRSIQSLTDCRAPKNIRELIEAVEQEFQNYEVDKLAKSFVTLQTCLRETMKFQGEIGYEIPHMGKDKRLKEGRLPIALNCKAELVADTLKLIGEAQAIDSSSSNKEEKAEQLKQLFLEAAKKREQAAAQGKAAAQEKAAAQDAQDHSRASSSTRASRSTKG